MATDLEKLVVSLEASISKYEKTMNRAMGISNQRAKQVESRWAKLNIDPKGVMKNFARGAVAALLPTLSLAAALQGAKTALKEFGDVADNAKAAGIDPEFFQGIAYQAQQGGVEINEISGALATFAKNSGLAIEGRGKMATALKALDVGLLENIRNATSQEERIKLVADALAKETDASKRAAIATAAFGDAGLKLAGVFAGGAAEIEKMQVRAKEMGLIVDRELIARADELGDEFDTTTQIVHLQLMQALVDLGPVLVWLSGLAGGLAEQIGGAVDNLKPLSEQRRSTIEGSLWGIQQRENDVNPAMTAGLSKDEADALRKPLLEELRRRAMDDLRRQLTSVTPPTGGGLPSLEETEERNKAAAAAIKQAEATKAYVEQLRFENSLIGLSAIEQAKLTAVRQSGAAATSEEAAEVARLTEAGFQLNAQIEAQKTLYDELGQVGQAAIDGIIDAMADGKVEGEELMGILSNVLSMASNFFLNQAFGSIGGGGNIFSSLLGGATGATGGAMGNGLWGSAIFRANGGPVSAGQPYIVGERLPELFVPNVSGKIVPRVPAGGSGGDPLNLTFHLNGGGQDMKDFVRFELPGIIRRTLNDPHAIG